MPTVVTRLAALSVTASVDSKEMESTAQVSPAVKCFENFVSSACLFLALQILMSVQEGQMTVI